MVIEIRTIVVYGGDGLTGREYKGTFWGVEHGTSLNNLLL